MSHPPAHPGGSSSTGGWHKLLARQLRRHFPSVAEIPPALVPFLEQVQQAYRQADDDRALMEHSLETVSRELADRLARMQSAIGEREEVQRAYAQLEAAQEQLRQSQRMEAIGQLAGGVAHDFNNLLTVIRGNIELVLSASEASPSSVELLREVILATDRATRLTNQLLAYSRKQTLQQSVFDLADTVKELRPMLSVAVGPRITFELALHPAFIRADRSQLDQVLLNLVINARDAMRSEGNIGITTRIEEVRTARRAVMGDELPVGVYSVLCVADTGTGVPPELRDRIFEPFFTTKRTGEGTGLGLSMVYGLVRQTGGYVALEPGAQQGTIMRIYLPAVDGIAPSTLPDPQRPADRRVAQRLLLVDDEEGVRRLLGRVLRHHGFDVQEAANGRLALELVEQSPEPFDLVVSDVVMPELNGRELARQLRTRRPQLPVLFVSGYSPEEVADLGGKLDDGVTLLPKPFSIEQLLTSVRSLLP